MYPIYIAGAELISHVHCRCSTYISYTLQVQHLYPIYIAGAALMHVHNAHAATDVTGFGILGHANNMAKFQKNAVSFIIHSLPIIAHMAAVAKVRAHFKLLQGTSAETSGNIVLCINPKTAKTKMNIRFSQHIFKILLHNCFQTNIRLLSMIQTVSSG